MLCKPDPVTDRKGPKGCEKSRLPHFLHNLLTDGGKVVSLRAAAHQLCQDKNQDMRQKMQSCFIRDSDSSPHTEVARVCVLSHLL
jgi:ABC-type oligopeptide transport system ATPase subunit